MLSKYYEVAEGKAIQPLLRKSQRPTRSTLCGCTFISPGVDSERKKGKAAASPFRWTSFLSAETDRKSLGMRVKG